MLNLSGNFSAFQKPILSLSNCTLWLLFPLQDMALSFFNSLTQSCGCAEIPLWVSFPRFPPLCWNQLRPSSSQSSSSSSHIPPPFHTAHGPTLLLRRERTS